jgi:hypothetical protein
MTLVVPDGVPTLGAIKVKGVLTIANSAAPSLATEINAASSKDISVLLYPAGWSPTGETAIGTAPARLGSKTQKQQFNRTTYSIGSLQYVHDPQGLSSAAVNAAKTLLTNGLSIHLVERRGPDATSVVFAVGDKVRDHYVVLGAQIEMGDAADENGEFWIQQAVHYISADGPVSGTIAT